MQTETKIYVSTYAKYNSGSLKGKWVTVQDYNDAEELFSALAELHEDEESPEFMIQDREGHFSGMIEESMSIQDFQEIYDVIEALGNTHLDIEVIEAYADNLGSSIDAQLIENCEEAYQGSFDSDADFAENLAEEMGLTDKKQSWPHYCIDWDYAARELMYDYFESKGHYFRNI